MQGQDINNEEEQRHWFFFSIMFTHQESITIVNLNKLTM